MIQTRSVVELKVAVARLMANRNEAHWGEVKRIVQQIEDEVAGKAQPEPEKPKRKKAEPEAEAKAAPE